MSADKRGYYAALGVSSSASASEIKSAYRRLAKLHHPDHSTSVNDGEIKRLNEAYAVLGNAENRAKYDTECAEPVVNSNQSEAKCEPLRCNFCNKIAAQPKYIVFWRVISLLIATSRTPVQGLFCSSCAKIEALKSTTITAVLGWWGVPWGPIWTAIHGVRNALGGEQDKARNDALAWHNVVSFIQMREYPVAYGIAEKLVSSKTRAIREAAGDFTALCRSKGLHPSGALKDPWETVRNQTSLRLGILAIIPTLAISAIVISDSDQASSSSVYYETTDAQSPSDTTLAQPFQLETTPATAALQVTPPCSHVPSNGKVLSGRDHLAKEGHQINIDNGSAGDAIVKIRNRITNDLYASFFVKKGESATLSGVVNGDYVIQYAVGDNLDEDCKSFSGNFRASSFPQMDPLYAQHVNDARGEGYIYNILSYTLYAVPGGNVRPTAISPDAFNS